MMKLVIKTRTGYLNVSHTAVDIVADKSRATIVDMKQLDVTIAKIRNLSPMIGKLYYEQA